MFAKALLGAVAAAGVARAQVTATGTMGETNPPEATLGTAINQNSMARLVSLNALDDFCLFGPPEPNSVIGDTETEEIAWCVQPRNNARVIPDGTFTGVHMVKTPLYWQIQGWGDLTKLNIADGDFGGELDPHGATGKGNPIGGNVTTNATGTDVHYEEWMNYISFNTFCLRICIADNATYSAASMCQHTLDIMGCEWVMPGDYTDNSFTVCDADPAYPPGVYPEANGGFSTFAQRWTGSYAESGAATFNTFTIGDTITPSAPAMTPASSNCVTYSSIGNGIPPAALSANASFVFTTGMSFSLPSITSSASGSATASGASGSATATPSDKAATGASAGKSGTKATGSSASASAAAGTTNNAASAAAPMVALVSAVAVFIGAASVLF